MLKQHNTYIAKLYAKLFTEALNEGFIFLSQSSNA